MVIAIKIKVYLKENLQQDRSLTEIAKFIDSVLCKQDEWKLFHESNMFKPYCFSGLAPISQNKIYSKDGLYTFTIRTLNSNLANYLVSSLPDGETAIMKGIVVECWEVRKKLITKLYSLTPIVIRIQEGGYWKGTISFDEYEKQLFENLIKKYNYFYGGKINESFQIWENIRVLNDKPCAIPYKNSIKLLGDKLEMEICESSEAQEVAYMALATGIGTINSRGAGYVNYHVERG